MCCVRVSYAFVRLSDVCVRLSDACVMLVCLCELYFVRAMVLCVCVVFCVWCADASV